MSDLDTTFMMKAACRGMDADLFMPVRGENLKIRAAKEICRMCPVKAECAEYGLQLSTRYDTYGIFGGYTRSEREAMLKDRGMSMATWAGTKLVGATR